MDILSLDATAQLQELAALRISARELLFSLEPEG
jgi:hypothetical protein